MDETDNFGANPRTQQHQPDDSSIFQAETQPAYLLNGNLQSALSWLDHSKCTPDKNDFNVRIQSVRCARQMSTERIVKGQCVVQLEQLYFSCEYLIEVRDVSDGQLITRVAFSTAPCSRTPTSDREKLDCKQYDEQPTLRQAVVIRFYSFQYLDVFQLVM